MASPARVDELQAIFPAIDRAVVAAVLEAHGGGEGDEGMAGAMEDLLQLSDPEYRPEHTQSALDAEYARSLAAAEHAQHRQLPYQPRTRRPSHQTDGEPSHPEAAYGYRGGGSPSAPTGDNAPGIQALEEKFEKLAHVGKQKFDFLLSRAKEKYQDISAAAAAASSSQQQSRAEGATGHGDNPPQGLGYGIANTLGGLWSEATAAVAARTAPSDATTTAAAAQGWNEQAAKLGAGVGNAAQGLRGWLEGAKTAALQKTSGDNTEYPSLDSPGPSTAATSTQPSGPYKRWQPTDTYETDTQPRSINIHHPASSASSTSSIPSTSDDDDDDAEGILTLDGKDNTPRPTSHLAAGVPHGAPTGTTTATPLPPPGKIDLSKIGMLPKKKVSLLPSPEATASTSTLTGPTTATTATTTTTASLSSADLGASAVPTGASKHVEDDDEEEEEYTKNPFEER